MLQCTQKISAFSHICPCPCKTNLYRGLYYLSCDVSKLFDGKCLGCVYFSWVAFFGLGVLIKTNKGVYQCLRAR